MNIYKSELFPYIAGDSLVGRPVTLTMKEVKIEPVSSGGQTENKPVLYFEESKKGMILNKTNAKRIAKLFGGETDEWTGQPIELYSEEVKAFGDTHNAVRVRESRVLSKAAQKRNAKMNTDEHKERLEKNPLQPPSDNGDGIGDDAVLADPAQAFYIEAAGFIPYFKDDKAVKAAMVQLEIEYNPDERDGIIKALSGFASKEADKLQDSLFPGEPEAGVTSYDAGA